MSRYSPVFKRELVEKLLSIKDKSVDEIAKEYEVSRATAFRWMKEYALEASGLERRSARPQEWSLAAKMKVLIETRSMREEELGLYLRTNGLYHCHLDQWKEEVLHQVARNKKLNKANAKESILLQRVRELQKELKLKDKALREATALLALKKKADLIWADREEEKSETTTEEDASSSSTKRKQTAAE